MPDWKFSEGVVRLNWGAKWVAAWNRLKTTELNNHFTIHMIMERMESRGALKKHRQTQKQGSRWERTNDRIVPDDNNYYVQSCKSGRAFQVGPGSISGLYTKLFYNILWVTIFSWRRFVVLNAVTSESEVTGIFLQIIIFANATPFFCSFLGLVSHSFWEGDRGAETSTRWNCVEKINHVRDSWLVSKNDGPQTGFSCL